MASNKTPNLNLPQYSGTDLFNLEEVNESYKKIDNSYKEINDNYNKAIQEGSTGNLEVIDARDGYDNLGQKIKSIDSSLETKAKKEEVQNVQQQVNNLVLGAVGDGNNAEIIQARDNEILLATRLSNIENGERVLIEGNISYANEFNSKSWSNYKGGSSRTDLAYIDEAGHYEITLKSNFVDDFTPYITMDICYIPFDINKIFTIDGYTNGSNGIIRFYLYDSTRTQVGAAQGINIVENKTYEYTTNLVNVAYIGIYNISLTTKVLDSTFGIRKFIVKDKTALNLKEKINKIEKMIDKRPPYLLPYKCRTIAHSGNPTNDIPENTVRAFSNAGKLGYWCIETDLFTTSDGEIVCIHDGWVDDLTTSTGLVKDFTLAQLKAMTLRKRGDINTTYPDKIPTLQEFLKVCRIYGCIPMIELKVNFTYQGQSIPITWDYSKIVSILREYGYENHAIVESFWPEHLQGIRNLSQRIHCMIVLSSADTSSGGYVKTKILGNCGAFISKESLTDSFITQAKNDGMTVGVWTVYNDEQKAIELRDKAVDFIATEGIVDVCKL